MESVAMTQHDGKAASKAIEPDWSQDTDVRILFFDAPLRTTGNSSIAVGEFFPSGGTVSGVVERLVLIPSGVVRATIRDAATGRSGVLVFGTYSYAEMMPASETKPKARA
jgi:hypothetical protein